MFSTSQNISGIANSTTPAVDPLTNRFVTAGTTFEYDLNGNLVRDQEGWQFTFNGDNKQSQVKDASNNVVGTYFYDGEGHRVKKVTQTETVVYVYSNGRQIAEYSTAAPPADPTTNYTATDMLGSPRVLTDSLGNVVSRRDFLPFGEELYADGVHRTVAGKYSQTGQDGVRKRFTGYEKDAETSLDFAEAIILGFGRLCLSICGEALLHRLRRFQHLRLGRRRQSRSLHWGRRSEKWNFSANRTAEPFFGRGTKIAVAKSKQDRTFG